MQLNQIAQEANDCELLSTVIKIDNSVVKVVKMFIPSCFIEFPKGTLQLVVLKSLIGSVSSKNALKHSS